MSHKLYMTIDLGNAAMQRPAEVARAVRIAAEEIDEGYEGKLIRDDWGNTVGHWSVTYPKADERP